MPWKNGVDALEPMNTLTAIAYDSPTQIRQFLDSHTLAMSKRFGQNFLIDRAVRERLYRSLELDKPGLIWEVGPGLGAMTTILLGKGNRVVAFEIDHGFARVLRDLFPESSGFELIEGDFLKKWNSYAVSKGGATGIRAALPDRIFGNLPYSAALAIIADLLENDFVPPKMLFTVQKEAAQRIAAKPGTKDYSAFSVLCSSVCSIRVLYDIGASAFWPQPRVTSSVVALTPRADPVAAQDRQGFSRFVRCAFASRRKTLHNNLVVWNPDAARGLDSVLAGMHVLPTVRAESLKPEELAQIYFALGAGAGHGPCPSRDNSLL